MTAKWVGAGIVRFVCALLLGCFLTRPANGQVTRTWAVAGTGNWHDANNWEPNTDYPRTGETAIVDQGEAQIGGEDAAALKLWIAPTAGSVGSVQVGPGRSLVLYSTELDQGVRVGQAGCGTFTQEGNVSGYTYTFVSIGGAAAGTGVYLLQSTGVLSNIAELTVGNAGTGSLAHSGGAGSRPAPGGKDAGRAA